MGQNFAIAEWIFHSLFCWLQSSWLVDHPSVPQAFLAYRIVDFSRSPATRSPLIQPLHCSKVSKAMTWMARHEAFLFWLRLFWYVCGHSLSLPSFDDLISAWLIDVYLLRTESIAMIVRLSVSWKKELRNIMRAVEEFTLISLSKRNNQRQDQKWLPWLSQCQWIESQKNEGILCNRWRNHSSIDEKLFRVRWAAETKNAISTIVHFSGVLFSRKHILNRRVPCFADLSIILSTWSH